MSLAIIFIMCALVFYTTAIWSEKIFNKLSFLIIFIFGTGFMCDCVGTYLMSLNKTANIFNFHRLFGFFALFVMFIHFIWALIALFGSKQAQKFFTRFSIYAWFIWLIAFLSGVPWDKFF